MDARNKYDVVIAGAGPVGLSAALALGRAGIFCAVIDQAVTVDKQLRASTFHPPTLDMIAELGIAEQLVAQGLQVPRWQMRQHESACFVEFDLSAIADATSHPYRLQCEQHKYCELAIEALRALPNVALRLGNRLEEVYQDENGVIAVIHSSEETTRIASDWLIGADGADSTVRKTLGLEYSGSTYEHHSVLVTTSFPFHDYIDNLADVTYCWSAAGPFSLLRLPGRWRASLYPGTDDVAGKALAPLVNAGLRRIVSGAGDAHVEALHPYRVHQRSVDRYRVDRVLLAGDAAHINPPSGGMGMNGGIHDAINLAEKLIQVIGGEPDTLLDRYHRQRHTLVTEGIIPQAAGNRKRMQTRDIEEQRKIIGRYQEIVDDPARYREYLLTSSMISGLRRAATIL